MKTFRILLCWFFKVKIGRKWLEKCSCPLEIDCYWRGYICHAICSLQRAKWLYFCINWNPEIMVQFCYLRFSNYSRHWHCTVSCLLLQRWTWIQTWKTKTLGQLLQILMLCLRKSPKYYYGLVLSDEIFLIYMYLLITLQEHNSSAVIARVLNKNAVSWQTRNNRQLPKHKLRQNAKNLQCLLKFGLIEDNVTVFQWPWNSESG